MVIQCIVLPAPQANAAVPDAYGFAVWDGTAAVRKTPATTSIVETPAGSGSYRVKFPGRARPNGFAHVTAINGSGRWCQLTNWGTALSDVYVYVDCYGLNGSRQSSRFAVMYASSSLPLTGGGEHAYYAYNLGGPPNQFNSTGAVDAAPVREGAGTWMQKFAGMGGPLYKGQLQVTALDGTRGARCKIAGWWIDAGLQQARVQCFAASGVLLDTRWVLSYHQRRNVVGVANGHVAYGTLWWPGDRTDFFTVAETNYNSITWPNTVARPGTGHYVVTLPQVAAGIDHVQVTAYGHLDNRWCQLAEPWTVIGADVEIKVLCFAGGQYANSGFFVTYASTG